MLVLHREPESFDEDIVHSSPLAVHTDLDAVGLQDAGELLTAELTNLIGVEDLRPALVCNGFFLSLGVKVHVHGVRQPPRQNLTRGPVYLGYQLRIHLVLEVLNRRSRLLVQRRDAHLAHQTLPPTSGDVNAQSVQLRLDAAGAHVGMLQMQRIDPRHQIKFYSRMWSGQPIVARAWHAQKLALGNYASEDAGGQSSLGAQQSRLAERSFKKSFSKVNCPILACNTFRSA